MGSCCLLSTDTTPTTLDITAHTYQPGDSLKTWTEEPLQEKWKGPYQVLLTINAGVKMQKVDSWFPNLAWLKQLLYLLWFLTHDLNHLQQCKLLYRLGQYNKWIWDFEEIILKSQRDNLLPNKLYYYE